MDVQKQAIRMPNAYGASLLQNIGKAQRPNALQANAALTNYPSYTSP